MAGNFLTVKRTEKRNPVTPVQTMTREMKKILERASLAGTAHAKWKSSKFTDVLQYSLS